MREIVSMPSDISPASAGSILAEITGAVRAALHRQRAAGLPLKAAAPIVARHLGLPGARRVLAYHHGEVAGDDVRAVELEAVRRAVPRALAADARHRTEIEAIKTRLAALEQGIAHGRVEDRPLAAGFLIAACAGLDGAV